MSKNNKPPTGNDTASHRRESEETLIQTRENSEQLINPRPSAEGSRHNSETSESRNSRGSGGPDRPRTSRASVAFSGFQIAEDNLHEGSLLSDDILAHALHEYHYESARNNSEPSKENKPTPQQNQKDATPGERRSNGSVKFAQPLNKADELEKQYEELLGGEVLDPFSAYMLLDAIDMEKLEASKPPEKAQVKNDAPSSPSPAREAPTRLNEQRERNSVPRSSPNEAPTDLKIEKNSVSDSPPYETPTNLTEQSNDLPDMVDKTSAETTQQQIVQPILPFHRVDEDDDDVPDLYGAFEITPEDIFNEIKVARTANPEQEHAQNLHSFIISKTFSSENIVVLLNLRRLKDGEWVLDKTIAQGLKPQTYGGVVSIDKYNFVDEPPPTVEPPQETPETDTTCPKNKNIMEILNKLEECVAEVNREIQEAREIIKKYPRCSDDPANANEVPNFDELPFVDKLVKMFNALTADDDEPCCNLCDSSQVHDVSQSAISYWLRSVMKEIAEFCPKMLLPKAVNDLREIASTTTDLISQSEAIIQEVKKSGLINSLSNNGLLNIQPDGGALSHSGIHIPSIVSRSSVAFMANKNKTLSNTPVTTLKHPNTEGAVDTSEESSSIDPRSAESYQLNIESKDDLNEFIKEHEGEL